MKLPPTRSWKASVGRMARFACIAAARIGLLKGKATRPGIYKCYACRKQFRVTVGTVFEASHIPLHQWLQAVYLVVSSKKGISSNQIALTMGITVKSAWFMTHRIREAMKGPQWPDCGKLGGGGLAVEAGETFVVGKAENRTYGPIPPKQAVFTLVGRNGTVSAASMFQMSLWPIWLRLSLGMFIPTAGS